MFEKAVLLIGFNRPKLTRVVMEAIRAARPQKLYFAVDGPREQSVVDFGLCREVRELRHLVDWPCDVKTLFREANLGCKHGVKTAIDWFFDKEEQGVVLEDDTVPSPDFFPFAFDMLDRFQEDSRVMRISGFNPVDRDWSWAGDFLFSRYSMGWGWASWRRAWELNDLDMASWAEVKSEGFHRSPPFDPLRNAAIQAASEGLDTWDYQWDFSVLLSNGLTVVPRVNLVKNIGFGPDATHTLSDFTLRSKAILGALPGPYLGPTTGFLPNPSFEKAFKKAARRDRRLNRFRGFLVKVLKAFRLAKERKQASATTPDLTR